MISQLFPHCSAATALALKVLYITGENLGAFRINLLKEANKIRKFGMLFGVVYEQNFCENLIRWYTTESPFLGPRPQQLMTVS